MSSVCSTPIKVAACTNSCLADPDRSNPTRPRMERPLDTIRSFNAAAEGTSRSRASSYVRPTSQYGSEMGGNRRSSYYSSGSYKAEIFSNTNASQTKATVHLLNVHATTMATTVIAPTASPSKCRRRRTISKSTPTPPYEEPESTFLQPARSWQWP